MSSWSGLSIYADNATFTDGQTLTHTRLNTDFTSIRDAISNVLTEGLASERHHDNSAAPDDTSDGVIWSDSANALHKLRQAGAWESIATDSNTLTLSNKTIAGPVITGVTTFPDGSAAAPSITNTGDTDTGIFFPAANAVGIAAFGVEPLRITVTTDLTDAVVAVLSTEESTSPTTGALTVGDGLGVAGACWVGGLLNVAGAATFQAGGSLAGTFSGTPTISGAWTFEANQVLRGGSFPSLSIEAYSTTASARGTLLLKRSRNASVGTLTETNTGDSLSLIAFQGVNTSSAFFSSASVEVIQRGSAGASGIPSDIHIGTGTAAAAPAVRVIITTEGNLVMGASALAPTSLVGGIVIANGTAASASAANSVAMWAADRSAGNSGLYIRAEGGEVASWAAGILSLISGGTNADRTLEFASDATIKWDEAGDEFELDKSIKLGALSASGWPSAWAYRSAALSAQDFTTATEIVLDAEVYDTNSNFNLTTGRFTPTQAGKYLAVARIAIAAWSPSTNVSEGEIRRNGATSAGNNVLGYPKLGDPSTAIGDCVIFGIFDMNGSTDYLSLFLLISTDSSVDVVPGAHKTYFTVTRIA